MTLSSKQIGEIAYLYESIAASEQEQLNEDLNDKIKRGLTNQAFGNKPTSPTTPLNLNPGSGDASSLIKTGLDSVKKPTPKPMSFAQTQQTNRAFGNAWNEIRAGKKETQTTQQQTPNTQTSATAKPQTVAAAGGKGGTVTAGKQYAATLGGQKGNVTYDASGAKKFTPSASTSAKTLPSKPAGPAATAPAAGKSGMDIWKAKYANTLAKNVNPNGTQKGTGQSTMSKDAAELRSMQSASQARQGATPSLGQKASGLSLGSSQFKPATTSQATAAAPSTSPAASGSVAQITKTIASAKPTPVAPKVAPAAPAGGYSTREGDGKPRKKEDILFSYQYEDAYDLVLEYLLDNGHVDTVDEAHYVMMELDAEVIQDIVEEVLAEDANYDRNRRRAAQRAAARNAARDAGKTGAVPGVGYVTPRRESETYRDSTGTERHKSGAKMPEKKG